MNPVKEAFDEEWEMHFQAWADAARMGQVDDWRVAALCESPIESRLLGAIRWMAHGYNSYLEGVRFYMPDDPLPQGVEPGFTLIKPQVIVGAYRADFMLYARDWLRGWFIFNIECDGHDFHEKTREQAEHDKARDRFFTSDGVTVVRFTGSEIYRDANACVEALVDIIASKYDEQITVMNLVEARR